MKHKDHYDNAYLVFLADKIKPVLPEFDKTTFISNLRGTLHDKELFDRFDQIVSGLEANLPDDYSQVINAFFHLLGPELETTSGMFNKGWWLWPIGRYIEKNGLKNWRLSMKFIKELTKRFTGEFAVRPLIQAHPKKVVLIMLNWSTDHNVHVRRLASEGLRIRLPWAQKLYTALDEFSLYQEILENLKDDSERFIQKSVGNNLNDLFKEAPDLATEIIAHWNSNPPLSAPTKWIIAHGTRNIQQT